MLVLDRKNEVTSQPRAGAGRIRLRMRPDGRLVELPQGKTTIGSSPRCDVRIEQPGVQPLHCLVVQSDDGIRVRSWAANAKLNGAPFVEAGLSAGDCVSVGPVEFEIIDTDTPVGKIERAEPVAVTAEDSIEIRAARDLARSRSRKLLETLRRERAIYRESQGQVADLQEAVLQGIEEGNGVTRNLENAEQELALSAQRIAEYEGELASLRAEIVRCEEELSSSQRRIAAYEDDLASMRPRMGRYEQELATALQVIAERQEELALAQQKSAEHKDFAHQRDELAQQNEELSSEVSRSHEEISRLTRERDQATEERQNLALDCAAFHEQLQSLKDESSQGTNESAARLGQLEAKLSDVVDENSRLAVEKASLSQDQDELRAEIGRLAVIEREMNAIVAAKNSITDELQRALLQVAELQEFETRARDILANNDALLEEHDRLNREVAELRELRNGRSDERERMDNAWQALTAEAARLAESREELEAENARLRDALVDLERQLADGQQTESQDPHALEVERRLLAEEAQATIAAAIAEMERRLADQTREYTESFEDVQAKLTAALEVGQSLKAEAARLSESREELAEENAKLSAALDELRQQLADSRQTQSQADRVLANERERSGEEAEATIATAVAKMEQRLAEQAREYGESIKAVREELAAAIDARDSLELARENWQRQAAKAAELQAEQSKKIAAFEERLAAVQSHDNGRNDEAKSVAVATNAVAASEEQSERSAASQTKPLRNLEEATTHLRALGVLAERQATNGSAVSANTGGARHDSSATVIAEELASGNSAELTDRTDAFQGRTENVAQAKQPESTSFIDRYAHMFTDDDGADCEQRPAAGPQAEASPNVPATPLPTSGTDQVARPKSSSAKNDEEESIEQYMAKLLQRVRGDSNPSSTFVPAPVVPLNAPPNTTEGIASDESQMDDTAGADEPDLAAEREVKRKSVAREARTDLGALRALANETARAAISFSELRKHRRNAVTKVIVSTLAGVTSLWLMLDSPDCKDIQFITACVSLVVAAIWAGETYRTMLHSFRAAAYDGPEAAAEDGEEGEQLAIELEAQGSL
jgi:chromosome segregation ATPase